MARRGKLRLQPVKATSMCIQKITSFFQSNSPSQTGYRIGVSSRSLKVTVLIAHSMGGHRSSARWDRGSAAVVQMSIQGKIELECVAYGYSIVQRPDRRSVETRQYHPHYHIRRSKSSPESHMFN